MFNKNDLVRVKNGVTSEVFVLNGIPYTFSLAGYTGSILAKLDSGQYVVEFDTSTKLRIPQAFKEFCETEAEKGDGAPTDKAYGFEEHEIELDI